MESNQKTTETIFINSGDTPQNLAQFHAQLDSNNTEKNNPKTIYGLTGLLNTMNTCYMNSAIQAFSHLYLLRDYFFKCKPDILNILKKNARTIFKDVDSFKLDCIRSSIPIELRQKIQNPEYTPTSLTPEEETIILNHTMTYHLITLLENMWKKNCVVLPTSFKRIFCEARDKFFYGFEQHDSEEAYSCILQKMQEELGEKKNVKFKTTKASVQDFLHFKNDITNKINSTNNIQIKENLLNSYKQKKREMPNESLIIEAFREMQMYYGNSYSRITEIFTGFLYSRTQCPDCGFFSNKFDPF